MFPGLEVIRHSQNLGVCRAYNRGLQVALARQYAYALIMNNDVILAPDCLSQLVKRARAPDQPAALAPLIFLFDHPEKTWFCGGHLDFESLTARHCKSLEDFESLPPASRFITACAMLLRMEAVRRVGWFDERIFMYYDDTDYSMRFARKGYGLEIESKAHLYHRVGTSSSGDQQRGAFRTYHILRSELYFWRKHLGWWRFHRRYCDAHLGNWINQIACWRTIPGRPPVVEAIIDALWYFLSGKRNPVVRSIAPAWFRKLMFVRPWLVAELMAFRCPLRNQRSTTAKTPKRSQSVASSDML